MKILLIAYDFPPINNGGVQRPYMMLKYLPRYGVDVAILTHSDNFTDLSDPSVARIFDLNKSGRYQLLYYPLRLLQKLSTALGRFRSSHEHWRESSKNHADCLIRAWRPDAVLATYPTLEALELGLFFSNQYKLPLITDFRDGMIFEPIENYLLSNHSALDYYKKIEAAVAESSTAIITVSDPISDYFQSRYDRGMVYTIPNGYDSDDFASLPIDQVNLDNSDLNVVYTGRFALSDVRCDVSGLIIALERLALENIQLSKSLKVHFLGEMKSRERRAMRFLINRGIVILHGMVTREESLAYQKAADLLLLVTSVERTSVATTKLFEYLHSGVPILALTKGTFAETILRESGNSWIFHPQDRDSIYNFFVAALSNSSMIYPCQNEEVIAKFDRSAQMEILSKILLDVYKEKGGDKNKPFNKVVD